MSERIKELKQQAGIDDNPDQEGLDLFAELIVEECVAQCWTVSAIEHKGTVISECSKRMRKHFGVDV